MWVSHWLGTGGLSDGGFGYSRWKKERAGEPILTGTGRWSVARPRDVESLSDGEREKLSRLMSLPYLQGYKEAPEIQNVSIYDPKKAYDGLNLYTSGHGPEAILMDMTGAVLHRWHFPIENVEKGAGQMPRGASIVLISAACICSPTEISWPSSMVLEWSRLTVIRNSFGNSEVAPITR